MVDGGYEPATRRTTAAFTRCCALDHHGHKLTLAKLATDGIPVYGLATHKHVPFSHKFVCVMGLLSQAHLSPTLVGAATPGLKPRRAYTT